VNCEKPLDRERYTRKPDFTLSTQVWKFAFFPFFHICVCISYRWLAGCNAAPLTLLVVVVVVVGCVNY
jgi:hypothetical protein